MIFETHHKECKIQCVPSEDKCPGISDLKAGHWWRTGVKIMDQYVERAQHQTEQREQAKLEQRRKNNFAKEQAKVSKAPICSIHIGTVTVSS